MKKQYQWSVEDLIENKNKIKRVFFYRICGTGMGAAACLLKEKGYEVEGGDNKFFPPMSTYLKSTNIPLYELDKINQEFLKSFDLIVVGNVVPNGSEDALLIEGLNVPFCSFPAALGALVLNDFNVVGIAGTHGKTTTTYFISQIFEALGEEPGYLIGGVIEGRTSSRLGNGKYFFIESDEYDSSYFEKISKLRMYQLKNMILTSLEFDHADIFESIEDIKDQFRPALKNISKHLIVNNSYQASLDLVNELKLNATYYDDTNPELLREDENGSSFKLVFNKEEYIFETNVIGKHNVLNIASCILFALKEGFEYESIRNAVKKLKMVKRRQEVRGLYNKALIIDDFAHHPRSVSYTIDSVRTRFPSKPIYVVFEPNSATARSDIFQEEFANALSLADEVVLLKPDRPTSVKRGGDINFEYMFEIISKKNKKHHGISELALLREFIDEKSQEDTIILVLSNGTCLDLWKSDIVNQIKAV